MYWKFGKIQRLALYAVIDISKKFNKYLHKMSGDTKQACSRFE